jgi:hypothetical protein
MENRGDRYEIQTAVGAVRAGGNRLGLHLMAGTKGAPNSGRRPPVTVKQWTSLTVVGERNFPPVAVWIMSSKPSKFERNGGDKLVILTENEYKMLVKVAHAVRCTTSIDKSERVTAMVTEYSEGREGVLCAIPCVKIHSYVQDMLATPGIEWTPTKSEPIRLFGSQAGVCTNKDEREGVPGI